MTPEQRADMIRRAVAGAPPATPEQLADLRQLLPPVRHTASTNTTSLELKA